MIVETGPNQGCGHDELGFRQQSIERSLQNLVDGAFRLDLLLLLSALDDFLRRLLSSCTVPHVLGHHPTANTLGTIKIAFFATPMFRIPTHP
jgi:hypothetical protein